MSQDDDLSGLDARRSRRVRIVAWVAIVALILTGGGATVLAVLFA